MHASPVAIAESFEHDDGITAEAAALHRIATIADEETRIRQEREETAAAAAREAAADARAAAALLEEQQKVAVDELERERLRIEKTAKAEAKRRSEQREAAVAAMSTAMAVELHSLRQDASAMLDKLAEVHMSRLEERRVEIVAMLDVHVRRHDEWMARVEAAEETARDALSRLAQMEEECKRLERSIVRARSEGLAPKPRRLIPIATPPPSVAVASEGELARAASSRSEDAVQRTRASGAPSRSGSIVDQIMRVLRPAGPHYRVAPAPGPAPPAPAPAARPGRSCAVQ